MNKYICTLFRTLWHSSPLFKNLDLRPCKT